MTYGDRITVAALIAWLVASAALAGVVDYGGCSDFVPARVLSADPSDYLVVLGGLQPGDLLQLDAGTYPSGLPLQGVNGQPGSCIVIEGPASGPPAVFTGRNCCNTVSLGDSSYLVIRHLELDGQGLLGDGVKAEGTASWTHHITLEDLNIVGHGGNQQIVGINTKCPSWNWVIRRTVIEEAGTGIYLGNSDGEDELSNSLVEHNLIVDPIGYAMQIKHQNGRATVLGAPADGTTVVRHNVFAKASNASSGGNARPNLLIGHLPLAGPGMEDDYLVYGNFFYQNETGTESLFQGEGNLIVYDNLFVNDFGPALRVQPHNDEPRRVRVFQNTIVAAGTGASVTGGAAGFEQRLVGNASFANPAFSGGTQVDNIGDTYAAAGSYLVNADGAVSGPSDRLDLYPLDGPLEGTPIDLSGLDGYLHWGVDFDGQSRPGTHRGAYGSDDEGALWLPTLELKPEPSGAIFSDGFESGDIAAWSSASRLGT